MKPDFNDLKIAVLQGDLDDVKALLEDDDIKSDVDAKNNEILSVAALKGDLPVVQELLKVEGVRNNVHAFHSQVLLKAAENGHLAVVQELLKIDGVKNNIYILNNFLLCEAAKNGHLAVVQALLKIDSIKGIVNESGNPFLLGAAVQSGCLEMVQELLKIDGVKNNAHKEENIALCLAVEKSYGHLEVVQELLKIDGVRNNAHVCVNKALRDAASDGWWGVVQELLKIGGVRNDAYVYDNLVLRKAARDGQWEILKELLKIDAVKNNAHVADNQVLRKAAEHGHLSVVQELLKIDAVRNNAHVADNQALRAAVQNGRWGVVKELLNVGAVKDSAHERANRILYDAAGAGRLEVVKELLKIDAVKNNAHVNKNDVLRMAVQNGHLEVADELLKLENIQKILFDEPRLFHDLAGKMLLKNLPVEGLFAPFKDYKFYGVPVSEFIDVNADDFAEKFLAFANDPSDYINTQCPDFSTVKAEALRILWSYDKLDRVERERVLALTGDQENSMDDTIVLRSNKHFNEKVKPLFQDKFDGYGSNDAERVVNIEQMIRKSILKEVRAEAKEAGDDGLMEFIDDNLVSLMQAEDEVIMQQARDRLVSVESQAQAAWRGYDKAAPIKGGWQNLLTPQVSETDVFSTRASHEGKVGAKKASEIARERVAYYYLAIIDEKHPTDKASRMANFIGQLADIRRAHNDDKEPAQQDDPSCFPGTLTRIANMGNFHPEIALPLIMNPQDVLMTILNPKISALFAKKMDELETLEEKQDLFKALTMLSSMNAQEIIDGRTETSQEYTGELKKLRNSFRRDLLLTAEGILKELEEKLTQRGTPPSSKDTGWLQFLILTHWTDIGGRERAYPLRERLSREMPDIEEDFDPSVKNPFSVPPGLRKNLPPVKLRQIEERESLWGKVYLVLQKQFPEQLGMQLSELAKEIVLEYGAIKIPDQKVRFQKCIEEVAKDNPLISEDKTQKSLAKNLHDVIERGKELVSGTPSSDLKTTTKRKS